MVAAGSCVTAPLEGALLCNAAAAGSFAALETVKSQSYQQHVEAAAAATRRHEAAESVEQLEHNAEENTCFDAAVAVAPADAAELRAATAATDGIAVAGAAAARVSAGTPIPAAVTASVTPAAISAVLQKSTSARTAFCGRLAPEDCNRVTSASPASSSNSSPGCLLVGEAALWQDVPQQSGGCTTEAGAIKATERRAAVGSSCGEVAAAFAACASCRKPRGAAVSFPAAGCRRRSFCACDSNDSSSSKDSSRDSSSFPLAGKEGEKTDRGGSTERCCNNDRNSKSSTRAAAPHVECNETSSSSGSKDNSSGVTDRRSRISEDGSSSSNSEDRRSASTDPTRMSNISLTTCVAATPGAERESAAHTQRNLLCVGDLLLEGNEATTAACVPAAATSFVASPASFSSAGATAQAEAQASGADAGGRAFIEECNVHPATADAVVEVAAAAVGAAAAADGGSSGGGGPASAAAVPCGASTAAAGMERQWKDVAGETLSHNKQQQEQAETQRLNRVQEKLKGDELLFLLASNLAVGGADSVHADPQQEQQQQGLTLGSGEQDSVPRQQQEQEKSELQAKPQIGLCLQSHEKQPQHEQLQQVGKNASSTLLRPGELKTARTTDAAAAVGATTVKEGPSSNLHLTPVWQQVVSDPDGHAAAGVLPTTSGRCRRSRSRTSIADGSGSPRLQWDNATAGRGHVLQEEQIAADFVRSGMVEQRQQQQAEDCFTHGASSRDSGSSSCDTASSNVSPTGKQPEVITEGRSADEAYDGKEADLLLPVFPSINGSSEEDRYFAALSWDVSVWQGVPLVEQLRQEGAQKQQEEEEQQEGEAEDVVMGSSPASQGSGAGSSSGSPAVGRSAVEETSQLGVVEDPFSFDLWAKHHVATGSELSSGCSNKERRAPISPTATAVAATCDAAVMQSQQRLSVAEVNSVGREETPLAARGRIAAAEAMNAAAAGEAAASDGAAPLLSETAGNKKEEDTMEEDMLCGSSSSGSEDAGALTTGGGGGSFAAGSATAASSVADTATVGAGAEEARLDGSGGEEEEAEEHHAILDTCLPGDEDAGEVSLSSFGLWAEQHHRLGSRTVAAAAAPAGLHLLSGTTAAAAGESATTAAAAAEVAAEEVADAAVSTSCSFFFSGMTEAACEEKSSSGCCAVVAGAVSDSVGLCSSGSSSSDEDDEDYSGTEDERPLDAFDEGDCGMPCPAAGQATAAAAGGGGGGVVGEADAQTAALLPAYTRRMLRKNFLCSSDPFQHEETVFIFDWDDTLLPSSWLCQKGLTLDSSAIEVDMWRKKLSAAAAHAEQTLHAARALGRVVIVTNAETGWIDLSCSKFMPDLAPLLRCFRIVSARSVYESSCCNTPFLWKVAAFTEELRRHFPVDTQCRWNVISVGDSTHEREALFSVCGRLGQTYNVTTKSLKLLEAPAVEDLHSQHELMLECLETVAKHKGNLDLCVASVLEATIEEDDYAGTPLPAGLEGRSVGLHCLRYHPLAPEVVGRA